MFSIVAQSVSVGIFWGAIVAAFVRWQGRGTPGVNERATKWFIGTALVLGLGFPLIHPHGF